MNLTKLFIAGLCVTAMTASAGFIKTNAFEGEASTDWWLGDGVTFTTVTVANDTTNNRSLYLGGRPMPAPVVNENVLKLDTLGAVWTNTVGVSLSTSVTNWVDMLVKFVPSETLPFIDTNVKLAVAVQQGTPNVLAISAYDIGGGTNKWNISGAIETNVWNRLTVRMRVQGFNVWASVMTNNVEVGEYYVFETDKTLTSIGFQGTGFIDEVVVRDDAPFGGVTPPVVVLLTLDFAAGIQSVYMGGDPMNDGDTVPAGTNLTITAQEWYEIASVTGPDTVTWVGENGLSNKVGTVTVSHGTATNVYITAQRETSTTLMTGSTSFTNAPMNKVADWALDNGVTEAMLSNGIYDQYLFNIPTNVMPSLFITSIAVSNTTVTVEVQTTNNVDLVTGINGTLMIKAYPVLGGIPEIITTGFTSWTNITVFSEDVGTNKFFKASVE